PVSDVAGNVFEDFATIDLIQQHATLNRFLESARSKLYPKAWEVVGLSSTSNTKDLPPGWSEKLTCAASACKLIVKEAPPNPDKEKTKPPLSPERQFQLAKEAAEAAGLAARPESILSFFADVMGAVWQLPDLGNSLYRATVSSITEFACYLMGVL